MLRHLHEIAASALIALGACSTTPAPLARELGAPPPGAPPPVRADHVRPGHLQVLVGTWGFDDSELNPRERQYAGGLTFSYENPANFLDFEVGLNQCIDDKATGIDITEPFFGVRKTFMRESALQPYVGAGLAFEFVSADIDMLGVSGSDDDICPAAYAHAGVRYALTDTFGLGLDGRIVRGTDVTLFGAEGDVDYEQLALFCDYRF